MQGLNLKQLFEVSLNLDLLKYMQNPMTLIETNFMQKFNFFVP